MIVAEDSEVWRAINSYLWQTWKEIEGVPCLDYLKGVKIKKDSNGISTFDISEAVNEERAITLKEFIDFCQMAVKVMENLLDENENER